ncbi:hypothetical protein [Prosthecobacter sp.]|uniref:hypothetical protein n=1 Tax=Prosthecobacter sp. TaxID=1965333 RepID=UPI003784FC40
MRSKPKQSTATKKIAASLVRLSMLSTLAAMLATHFAGNNAPAATNMPPNKKPAAKG